MAPEAITEKIIELRAEADEARHLASSLEDSGLITQLFAYARALEAHADYWELRLLREADAA